MKIIIKSLLVLLLICSLSPRVSAQCIAHGGGGPITSPLGAGRKLGSDQWGVFIFPGGEPEFGWLSFTFSGYLYDEQGVVDGFADRHTLEGVIKSTNHGPASCADIVNSATIGPCPNQVVVPDACPYWDAINKFGPPISYPERTFGEPFTYSQLVYGAQINIANRADVGTIALSSPAQDFGSLTGPPFQPRSYDTDIPNVAYNPYYGGLNTFDEVIISLPSIGAITGTVINVNNRQLIDFISGMPGHPTSQNYPTVLRGGQFIAIKVKGWSVLQFYNGAPVYTFKTVSSNANLCHQLIGTVVGVDSTDNLLIVQSFVNNIAPALKLADGHTYNPAGSCFSTGPMTPGGNIDNDGFTLNTPCNTDLAITNIANVQNFLGSACAFPNSTSCGTGNWNDVIASATINSGDSYIGVGYANGINSGAGASGISTNITTPYIHADYYCSVGVCTANQVNSAMLAATNSNGVSVATALQNWGIPTGVSFNQTVSVYYTTPSAVSITNSSF